MSKKSRSRPDRRRPRVIPRLEVLEDRVCPAPMTIEVTNLNSAGAGSLADAVNMADDPDNAGSTITFAPGLTGTITLAAPLSITQDTTISHTGGNLITIDGGGAVQDLNIGGTANPQVSISGVISAGTPSLVFTGGLAEMGGGIQVTGGSSLTLTDVAVTGNTATKSGGGIEADGAALTLSGCTVSGNTVASADAGVVQGGGIDVFGGTLMMDGVTLSNNLVRATGTTAAENAAAGGGIFLDVDSTATIQNSTLAGNQAQSGPSDPAAGGAIYNSGGPLTLINDTLTANTAAGSGGGAFGGALDNFGTANLSYVTLSLNAATDSGGGFGFGGGIENDGLNAVLNLLNSVFQNPAQGNVNGPDLDSSNGAAVVAQNNVFLTFPPDGTFTGDSGHNIQGTVSLGPLQNNGGPTATQALTGTENPAVGFAEPPLGSLGDLPFPPADQRGFPGLRAARVSSTPAPTRRRPPRPRSRHPTRPRSPTRPRRPTRRSRRTPRTPHCCSSTCSSSISSRRPAEIHTTSEAGEESPSPASSFSPAVAGLAFLVRFPPPLAYLLLNPRPPPEPDRSRRRCRTSRSAFSHRLPGGDARRLGFFCGPSSRSAVMFSVRRPSWFARRRFSRPKPGLNVRPNLEVLEDRCAPSGMPFNTQTSIHLSQAYNLFHLNETVSGQVFVPDIVPGGVSGGTVTITDGGQTRTVPINGDGTYSTTFDFNLFQGPPIKAHPVTVTYNGGGQISTPAPSPVPATDPVTAQADDTSFQYAATVLTDLYILSRFVGGPPGSQ